MWPYLTESRSKDYYDDDDHASSEQTSWDCGCAVCLLVILALIIEFPGSARQTIPSAPRPTEYPPPMSSSMQIQSVTITQQPTESSFTPTPEPLPPDIANSERLVRILVDDFVPQPYQGDAVYFYNRIEGDRGALNNSTISSGNGVITVTISTGNHWGGLWMSLNHPIREAKAINFSTVLPPQILPAYQSRITELFISIKGGTPMGVFRAELKDSANHLQWANENTLSGDSQNIKVTLPSLQEISQLVLVLDHATPGDFVVIDDISFTAVTPVIDTATAAFVWSYGMLLNNWDLSTGLVRDKARDASGEFDAVQATGSLAAATALAEQIGVVERTDAIEIVNKISETLLNLLPRNHGLWPHWVKLSSDGRFEIVPGTEWSSVDTVIAAIGLLDAQQSLGLETSATEQFLHEIEWNHLVTERGISHGYTYDDELIPYVWDVFGGESWLVELAYAGATGMIAPLAHSSPPTANGSGFIDELAWLYIMPPTEPDDWDTQWTSYRTRAVESQISYYPLTHPSSCFAQLGLFGLSAAEVPDPARVPKENIYQPFGIGGQFTPVNDGTVSPGSPVIAPHYSALVASLRPDAALKLWDWLIASGYFSPLTNVESLAFTSLSGCDVTDAEWNHLKGSWNLALQTLGWGRYLAEREGKLPATWQATKINPFLKNGYLLLVPEEASNTPVPIDSQSDTLETSNILCDDEADYKTRPFGTYRYRFTTIDANGYRQSHIVEDLSTPDNLEYVSAMEWPPDDPSIPPWINSTSTRSRQENLKTRLGTFQAFRIDTIQEYHIQTTNHSDPTGTVNRSEWYVCGYGLMLAKVNHSGMFAARQVERQSELELISFPSLP